MIEDSQEWDPKGMIVQFALDHPDVMQLAFVRDDPDGTTVNHISMGRMNYVFRVKSRDQRASVIIKHGRNYSRTVPWVEMTLKRQEIEYNALKVINEISPGSVPQHYCLDKNHAIIAMEDMGHMELLGSQIRRGEIDTKALSNLGYLIYNIHRATDKSLVTKEDWAGIESQFKNEGLRSSIRSLQLDRSLDEADPANLLQGETLNVYRNIMAEKLMEVLFNQLIDWYNTDSDCLVQADCHENAIFVQKGRCTIFDLEFCFLGHRAAHLAIPLRDIILAYHCCEVGTVKASILPALKGFMEAYFEGYDQAYNNHEDLISKITAFTGAFMFRMAIRRPMKEDWRFSTEDKINYMKLGASAMKLHETVTSIDSFIEFFHNPPETIRSDF